MIENILQSRFIVIKNLFYFNFLVSVYYLFNNTFTWADVGVISCVFFFMNPLGIAVAYHRYWSHRSFEFRNKFFLYLCTIPPLVSGSGSILGWVGIHRKHHAHSDKPGDPHLAANGIVKMLTMQTYHYVPSPKEVIDLIRDPFILNSHKYYFAFPLIYAGLLYLLFGFAGFVLGFCMPAALSMITQNTTNFVNHFSETEFKPRNVAWINVFNFGDGWHKNHHDNPKRYTNRQRWYELDLAGLLIKYVFAKSVID